MVRRILVTVAALLTATHVQAHEIWLEQDPSGPARVFIGEPEYPVPAGGDPEFPRLRAPTVFRSDPAKLATLTRRADHIEAALAGSGDIRLRDAAIFDPERQPDGSYSARIYYARAGRSEPKASLDFEIVPQEPGGNVFQILFKGQPTPREGVRIIRPDGWLKNIKSDEAGRFAVPTELSGRYLVYVDHEERADHQHGEMRVSKTTHVATLTFVKP
jgi:hypothetical protein